MKATWKMASLSDVTSKSSETKACDVLPGMMILEEGVGSPNRMHSRVETSPALSRGVLIRTSAAVATRIMEWLLMRAPLLLTSCFAFSVFASPVVAGLPWAVKQEFREGLGLCSS